MVYEFRVEGSDTVVTLEPSGRGWVAQVGDYRWTVAHWQPGHMLLDEGRSVRYGYSWDTSQRRGQVTLSGRPVQVERPAVRGQAGRSGGASTGRVKAPMNGQVVKVDKKVGEHVRAGEVVVVLEAMKMENEVTSPVEGTLESIHVRPGQAVAAGEPLFAVKPTER
jgi:acetyl-CoA/propionyl-CoA carboxylase biotin carboxyl carrier protein